MLPTISSFILLFTCTTFFNVLPTKAIDLKTYIVHLSSLEGQPRDIEQWYNSFLSKVASRSNEKPEMVYAYRHVMTGFAAKMSPHQAKMMEALSGVLSVQLESVYQLQTTRSSYFLGLHQNSGLWKNSNYGKGVIIGMIDSGVTIGHITGIGSGHVNPQKAHEPGFVYDIQPEDYIPYLCGLDYTPKQIEKIVKKIVNCSKTIPEAQLNYPSFAVSLKRGESKTYSRTVTNVGEAYSCYTLRDTSVPKGVSIKVVVDDYEDMIIFTSVQKTRTYEVTFSRDANDNEKRPYGQGHMTWVSDTGKCTVRIPISFKFE